MLLLISCLAIYFSFSHGQLVPHRPTPVPFGASPVPFGASPVPYGPTSLPYARATISPFATTIPTTIPPFGPFPYSPTSRPIVPGVPGYNNPYYNPAGPAVPILTYSNDHGGDGSYSFSFSTADGKQVQENGYLKDAYVDNAGEPQGTQVVQGSYAYVAPDGTPIQVSYVADENGFRTSGVHIPADGKGFPPLPTVVDGRKDLLNRYDPYNYRSRYNQLGPYNKPYDRYQGRYPYPNDLAYNDRYPYPYNTFNPYRPQIKDVKDTPKKESS